MKKMNKKGFTLAELLIVVAIIAVLVAIAIPVFSSQLEKSRQAADAANIRAAYAEAVTKSLDTSDTTVSVTTGATMKSASWDKLTDGDSIGGVPFSNISKTKGQAETVTITVATGAITFTAASTSTTTG